MRNGFIIIVGILFTLQLQGQAKMSREQYIQRYSELARKEMAEFGIPASIKLAQALLESDNGNSMLARKANNHFGIKCHSDWNGPGVYKDDDRRNECFRKYRKVEDSFRDHSLFLRERTRYSFLFELDPTDYKAWARGLKKAGYATNPRYPQLLIKIIEDNSLHKFDRLQPEIEMKVTGDEEREGDFPDVVVDGKRQKMLNNGVEYVLAGNGETYKEIADHESVPVWLLRKFNDVDKGHEPRAGEKVYLKPKKRKAEQEQHTCSGDESIWDISMKYAVKLKRLERINDVSGKGELPAGKVIRLR